MLKEITGEWQPIFSIERVRETAKTYNFEVAQNHDYFVGEIGWLVHNQSLKISPVAEDWVTKGAHIKVDGVELAVRPGMNGKVVFRPVFSSTTNAEISTASSTAENALINNVRFRNKLIDRVQGGRDYLGNHPSPLARGRSGELNFLLKALNKIE